MKISVAVPLILAFCASGAVRAADKPATASPTPAKKLVCFEQPRTGSNIKRKTCMTEEQAAKRRKEDQAAAEGFKRGSSGRSNSSTDNGVFR